MSVQDEIYQFIQQNYKEEFVTAGLIASQTGQSRNTVSHHLNRLVDDGRLQKIKSKPTQFCLSDSISNKSDPFDSLIGNSGSMRNIVTELKASVMYPHGLPLLLNGASGTGKSYIAKIVYKYAVEKEVLFANAPFVVLNCSDYANNPELLSSVLFGYTKDAFTGANQEKKGLVDEANGGYLFLDEIHNLTPENQEKLFLLIDSGKFRRLGENNQWHHAKVRLIMATTEAPESRLLTTFRRRIPYKILLPAFSERPYLEKMALIRLFFEQEATATGCTIAVNQALIKKLSEENPEGNIGQLKNEIKVFVANELAHTVGETIYIPQTTASKEKNDYLFFEEKQEDRYPSQTRETPDFISQLKEANSFEELKERMTPFIFQMTAYLDESAPTLEKDKAYFSKLNNSDQSIDEVLRNHGFHATSSQLQTIENLLYCFFEEHAFFEEHLLLKKDEKIHIRKYIKMSRALLSLFRNDHLYDYLSMILAAYLATIFTIRTKVNALVIMHGTNNAKTLSHVANEMLEDYVFDYFDMPIFVDTKEIIREIVSFTQKIESDQGLVILVDMGSLEKIYSSIKGTIMGDLMVMNNVSTALCLEVGHHLIQNARVSQLEEIDISQFKVREQYFEGASQKLNILVSCLSGEGIAVKIKDILEKYLPKDIEVLTFDYKHLQKKCDEENEVFFKNTLAIITTPKITATKLPVIPVEDIIRDDHSLFILSNYLSTEDLKRCTFEILKLFTLEGAASRLTFLNPENVINEVSEVIDAYEGYYRLELPNFIRMNLFLHLSMMIERLLKFGDADDEKFENEATAEFEKFCHFSDMTFEKIRTKYNISIPKSEYGLLYQLLQES